MKGWVITPLNINVIMGLKWSHILPHPFPSGLPVVLFSRSLSLLLLLVHVCLSTSLYPLCSLFISGCPCESVVETVSTWGPVNWTIYMCVCVCVCAFTRQYVYSLYSRRLHLNLSLSFSLCVRCDCVCGDLFYICVCVCVCVCVHTRNSMWLNNRKWTWQLPCCTHSHSLEEPYTHTHALSLSHTHTHLDLYTCEDSLA